MSKYKANCGTEFEIDAEMIPFIERFSWYINRRSHTSYVYTTRNKKSIGLHRVLMLATDGQSVDHINHNGLDNRISNLRICTNKQNCANLRPRKKARSGYIGVYFDKEKGTYRAYICQNGRNVYGGAFKNAIDAAKARDKLALSFRGEFANLNFPEASYDHPK